MISTDCGANAVQEVALAAELGLDVIVTDHHIVNTELPGAAAAINPHHPGDPYPFAGLAGVGVAYKLAEAVLLEAEIETAIDGESLLDFVALGTVADVVPLRGENRWLVREGLTRLNHSPRAGMAALIDAAGVESGAVTSGDIAFRLGPRINAAGRMDDAAIALDLLLESDAYRAREQAAVLNDLNRRRQLATEESARRNLHDDARNRADNGARRGLASGRAGPRGRTPVVRRPADPPLYLPARREKQGGRLAVPKIPT